LFDYLTPTLSKWRGSGREFECERGVHCENDLPFVFLFIIPCQGGVFNKTSPQPSPKWRGSDFCKGFTLCLLLENTVEVVIVEVETDYKSAPAGEKYFTIFALSRYWK